MCILVASLFYHNMLIVELYVIVRPYEFQVVIVPIWKKDSEKQGVLNVASSVKEVLQSAGTRVKLDDSDQRTPGWKFNFWELKVPFFHPHAL